MDELLTFSVYLVYGLAFFAIFFAILFRDLSQSRISMASALPTLAAFGLLHGLHEWSELYLVIYADDLESVTGLATFKVAKLWLSYIALGAFAWQLLSVTTWRQIRWIKALGCAAFIYFMFSVVIQYWALSYSDYLQLIANQVRLIFGFGAACSAGLVMYVYANELEHEGHGASKPFKLTGLALVLYGISAGVLTAEFGIWVIILRTVSAILILIFIWRALRVFDRERDIQLETRLQQSLHDVKLRELGELSSAVAHEIKTPLSSATMGCDILERQLPENDVYQRQLTRIRTGLERAADISQEVLNYAHKKPVLRERVNVQDVIYNTFELNRFRLDGTDWQVDCQHDLEVVGDAQALQDVISNLISNACDARKDGLIITFKAYQEQLNAVLVFKDNAGGMSKEIIANACKPFFTTKPKGEGTGMGLAIVNQLVMQHNGSMNLYNEGCGLTVEIKLPRYLK